MFLTPLLFASSLLAFWPTPGQSASAHLHGQAASFQEQCEQFDPAAANIANATVTNHAFVAAGTTVNLTGNDPSCGQSTQLVPVDLCRVALDVATSERSGVLVEVWLPESWNGRLVTTGNGGLGGCVDYSTIAYTSQNGFASVGTNNGHNGTSGIQFLNNEDVVVDFAWRAVHVGVETGKSLVSPFYANQANTSYFLGCSLGGRQGFKAADMFPDDFDGVVAGSPAADFNNLYSWRASFYPITGTVGSPDFVTPTTWKTTIHDEVLRQCDGIDGVADGIIEDSSLCHFDPSTLLCGDDGVSGNGSTCLTANQINTVRKIFTPSFWPNGTLQYPAMNPGGEILSADGLYDGQPWALSEGWFRYAVYNDPTWDPASYTLADAERADLINPGGIRTWPSSLAPFRDRGGKLIMFHGGQDNQITSFNSPRLYEHVRSGMDCDGDGGDISQMDEFLRFFRISGMFHCSGGPGAWVFGQLGAAGQGPFDASHNVLAAVVSWVEDGVAPETMTGTKFVNDTVSAGVDFERRHCRWPFRNTYLGGGRDYKDPDSWQCQRISEEDQQIGAAGLE